MNDQVLVIDDSVLLQQLVKAHLSGPGLRCLEAHTGFEGIAMAESRNPKLVLLDINLPDIDGYRVCQALRANPHTTRVPVIFLTTNTFAADKIRGLELGAVDFITKPCDFHELQMRVNAVFRTRGLEDQHDMHDELTGLWNNAYLRQHLPDRLTLARRTGQPMSCIVADIDGLRYINGCHGRPTGDRAICAVGKILRSQCNADDCVCSLGRGAFAMTAFGTDRHTAARLAARLAAQVELQLGALGEQEIGLKCCFGVADNLVATGNSMLERALAMLQQAKQRGPGNVSVARPARLAERLPHSAPCFVGLS